MLQRVLLRTYSVLPSWLQTRIKRLYLEAPIALPGFNSRAFVDEFFENTAAYRRYINEFEADIEPLIEQGIAEHNRRMGEDTGMGKTSKTANARFYALIRELNPETVVETGVCNGVSTLSILAALERNGRGSLYSVDFPDHPNVPEDAEPGWIIPEQLKERWELRLGLSQRELPALLQELDQVDMFFHDSDPSFPARLFEMEAVWTYLKRGGIIICDDVNDNGSFEEFANERQTKSGRVAPGVGYLVKERNLVPINWAIDSGKQLNDVGK